MMGFLAARVCLAGGVLVAASHAASVHEAAGYGVPTVVRPQDRPGEGRPADRTRGQHPQQGMHSWVGRIELAGVGEWDETSDTTAVGAWAGVSMLTPRSPYAGVHASFMSLRNDEDDRTVVALAGLVAGLGHPTQGWRSETLLTIGYAGGPHGDSGVIQPCLAFGYRWFDVVGSVRTSFERPDEPTVGLALRGVIGF